MAAMLTERMAVAPVINRARVVLAAPEALAVEYIRHNTWVCSVDIPNRWCWLRIHPIQAIGHLSGFIHPYVHAAILI